MTYDMKLIFSPADNHNQSERHFDRSQFSPINSAYRSAKRAASLTLGNQLKSESTTTKVNPFFTLFGK